MLGPILDFVGGIFGSRGENRANREELLLTDRLNDGNASVANDRNIANLLLGDRINDRNFTVQNRANDIDRAYSQQYNSLEARRAESFSAGQAALAFNRGTLVDKRNRGWALEDHARQRAELASRFVDDRAAAEAAGFNPFAVATGQMVPSAVGGIGSSSFAAASGIPGAPVSPSGAMMQVGSTPMAYGATVVAQPAASNAAIVGALSEFGREVTGQNAVGLDPTRSATTHSPSAR